MYDVLDCFVDGGRVGDIDLHVQEEVVSYWRWPEMGGVVAIAEPGSNIPGGKSITG